MNTRKAPFNDLSVRVAVDRSALRRIYGGELLPTTQILPPGMPGYRRTVLYPYDMAEARRLIAKAHPSDREITIWAPRVPEERRAAAYYRKVLQELGFTADLNLLKPRNYFAAIGKPSTPDLDTGLGNWLADYPHPNDFFESLLASWSIFPTFNENLAQIDSPTLDSMIVALGDKRGAIPEQRYAVLDRAYTDLAPWVSYGNPTIPLFVSNAVPLGQVIWNPSFGADLTSFRFSSVFSPWNESA